MMVVNHAHRNSRELEKSSAKLSSGKRINQAGDDAASLAISTNLNATTRGKSMAQRNSTDAISLIQVAEGSLTEVNSQITRLKELAIQSASSGVSSVERAMIQTEARASIGQIDQVAGVAKLFGKNLINGTSSTLDFQIDAFGDSHSRLSMDMSELNMTTASLDIGAIELNSQAGAQKSIDKITNAFDTLNLVRTKLGSVQSRLQAVHNNLGVGIENYKSANSTLIDTDYAQETATNLKQKIQQSASTSVAGQIHFNLNQAVTLIG